jgi:hypothetical protein
MAQAAWPHLVVLDAGLFTARCRACPWSSAGHPTLDAARLAFTGHRCLATDQGRAAC